MLCERVALGQQHVGNEFGQTLDMHVVADAEIVEKGNLDLGAAQTREHLVLVALEKA